MAIVQRLEVTDSALSRADTTNACAYRAVPQPAPRRRTILQTIGAMWRIWRERCAARQALAGLDARTLRDIGIAPEQVEYELWRSSWRPLLDWHAARYVHGAGMKEPAQRHAGSRRGEAHRTISA
ncbi:DUF1127 domain-containing protein [Vineibacter terrae]|uniref:DUF1127 domain-containing protein n=1 Tax=Vineibacter terrae TaxID=2586908 RepID=UPI002E2F2E46|nr:DUF1127 domain-containing protein [Vineibacter terrae]HEX2888940.1 DUF1127 domain-containing protein [Vineibacter terrae]